MTKPETWGTFEEALHAVEEYGLGGVGLVFTKRDEFAGVDLDDCINAQTGQLQPWAAEMIEDLASYTEISPSGTGVKIFLLGTKPGPRCSTTTASGKVELFDSGRFFTCTGHRIRSEGVEARQKEFEALYEGLFANVGNRDEDLATPAGGGFDGEDDELLEQARKARNGRKFSALYDEGDLSWHGGDHHRADLALCRLLAFWAGPDPERVDRLFRSSSLMREKWDEIHYAAGSTYGEVTVRRAVETCREPYNPKHPSPPDEVKRKVDKCLALAASLPWTGRTGPLQRHVYDVFLHTGGWAGSNHPRGFVVHMSYRYIALQAGVAKGKSARAAIKALEEEQGLIEVLKRGDDEGSTTYLVKDARTVPVIEHQPCLYTGTVRALLRQVRENSPSRPPGPYGVKRRTRDGERIVTYVQYIEPGPPKISGSIAKLGALLLEKVVVAGPQGLDIQELAGRLDRKTSDVKRVLARVLEAELLLEEEGVYRAPRDIESRMRTHLAKTGAPFATSSQRAMYEAERDPDRTATDEELARERTRMQAVYAERAAEDRDREEDRQRRKVGMTAKDVLREALAEGRIMWWRAVVQEGRPFKQSQLRRAAKELGVTWRKEWDGWYVWLRDEVPDVAVAA